MDLKDFISPEAGRVITSPMGYTAFVPAPLPPKLDYSATLVLALSRADSALSELSGVGRNLLNPHFLINPYRLREAVLSSKIEGTRASLSDLLIEEISPEASSAPPDDRREVRNYVGATNHGLARLDTLPLSLRLVCELYEHLMRAVRGDVATPGEFRRSQNWIGPQGSTPAIAPYVPPPPLEMQQCLHDWELFLHRRDELPDLIQCALMHEQFEAIHPFLDGNGRVGGMLITLFLIERKRLAQPLLYLSEFIEAHRQDYYDCLQRVRTHGDWQGWLLYFLRGVEETAGRAVAQAARLTDLRETLGRKLSKNATARNLLDELFVNPYVNVTNAAQRLKVSFPTAQRAITLLEKEQVLEEVSGRSWGRFYVSKPILTAIEDGVAKDSE